MTTHKKNLIIISGLAGSGKTVAIHALEDLGFYCIDNLPAVLLSSFSAAIQNNHIKSSHIALALDSRDQDNPNAFETIYSALSKICSIQIIYIKASEDIILRRYSETRRQHPLSMNFPSLSLQEVIKLDEKTLEPIKNLAHRIIDTSTMSSKYLRRYIYKHFPINNEIKNLRLHFISFGFKHGVPSDLDTLFDVRCFKNPYYETHLREYNGLNSVIKDYVFSDPNVALFINKVIDLIQFFYPLYLEEGKHHFSIGIGCTGGKHRSVAISEELFKQLSNQFSHVSIEHRHIEEG